MQAADLLIKKIASQPSTEELILFIADDGDMTRAFVALQQKLQSNNPWDIAELEGLCRGRHISLKTLTSEIQRILAIFAPDILAGEYAILGLEPDADIDQVKRAFRRLSIKYHPDASGDDNSDKFIEINQAYKTIISRLEAVASSSGQEKPTWRYKKRYKRRSPKESKKNMLVLAGIGFLLLFITVASHFLFRKNVMLHNLNTTDPILAAVKQETPGAAEASIQPAAVPEQPEPLPEPAKQQSVAAKIEDGSPKTPGAAEALIQPAAVPEKPEPLPEPQKQTRDADPDTITGFIDSYTKAYTSKNLQRFTRFFGPDALENGNPFVNQHAKYINLFQSVETLDLDIAILSTTVSNDTIHLKGRFRISLAYPNRQPVQRKGQIFFVLSENDSQYVVKELNYIFDAR